MRSLFVFILVMPSFACNLTKLSERGVDYNKKLKEDLLRYEEKVRGLGCTIDKSNLTAAAEQCDQLEFAKLTNLYKRRVEKVKQGIIDLEYQIHGCSAIELTRVLKDLGFEN